MKHVNVLGPAMDFSSRNKTVAPATKLSGLRLGGQEAKNGPSRNRPIGIF